jgi:tetratricopeptide (TPR) repeat protein
MISFKSQNVTFGNGKMLFARRQPMRFEFLALLAIKRLDEPSDQALVTLEEIARLPGWKGRQRHHIGTNIGRYLRSSSALSRLVRAGTTWAGPYHLMLDALSISFDLPLPVVRQRLRLRSEGEVLIERKAMLHFAGSYARAQWLFFQGKLVRQSGKDALTDDAYDRLLRMAEDTHHGYSANLRLLASISAADVLYRIGRFRVAREALVEKKTLLRQTSDLSLKARFHLSLAWAYQRSSTGKSSDRAVESALNRANFYAENSGDRAALGLLAYRKAGYLTKKRRIDEAADSFVHALEAYLITGNYYGIQATCAEIGSVIHRLGRKQYDEARRWLLLSIAIARLMNVGREDAHAEMILGKIYVERNKQHLSQLMLKRAERIADKAGNLVNLADVKMVWAFWYQCYGTEEEQIATLVEAVRLFRSLSEFDVPQKENYMRHRFSEVWPEVLKRASKRPAR